MAPKGLVTTDHLKQFKAIIGEQFVLAVEETLTH